MLINRGDEVLHLVRGNNVRGHPRPQHVGLRKARQPHKQR